MTVQHVYSPSVIAPERKANVRDGKGELLQHALLESPVKSSVFAAMSVMTIPPGASIGVHVHEHEEEAYVVIAGAGVYTSDEGEHRVGPGDIALCFKGERHGIANTGETDMIMAGILGKR